MVINMYDMHFLKQYRKEKGLTIYDMALILDITPSFYSQIENKKRRLFYDTAFKIALIFNMTPDSLFYPLNSNKNK